MDKQAFKQRMQNLKSYRENNPGKGYWDWRNSLPDNLKYTDDTEYNMRGAYESGAQPILENDGFYHLPTRNPQTGEILKTSLHPTFWKGLAEDAKLGYNTYFVGDKVYTKSKEEGPINVYADGGEVARKSLKDIRKKSTIGDKLDYNVMLQNQNTYQKEFATNWYKERAKNTKYRSQLGDGKLDKILSDIDKATWKNPTEAQFMEDYTSMKYGYIDPNPDLYYTKEQFTILDKWQQNSYFTNDEKDFIINYLIDCLVEGQPFDCSSLGPNKYLNE